MCAIFIGNRGVVDKTRIKSSHLESFAKKKKNWYVLSCMWYELFHCLRKVYENCGKCVLLFVRGTGFRVAFNALYQIRMIHLLSILVWTLIEINKSVF